MIASDRQESRKFNSRTIIELNLVHLRSSSTVRTVFREISGVHTVRVTF